jgi:hypothetical protein
MQPHKELLRYDMAGNGMQIAGAIVLCELVSDRAMNYGDMRFVTWFMTKGGVSRGEYFTKDKYDLAVANFEERCVKYDPTGKLHAAAKAGYSSWQEYERSKQRDPVR